MEYYGLMQQYKTDVREIYKGKFNSDEQVKLLQRIKDGDKEAENEFIERSLRFVLYIIKFKGDPEDFMDSIQEANLALCQIIKDKEKLPNINKNILAFIGNYIKWRVRRKEVERKYSIKIPHSSFYVILEHIEMKKKLTEELGQEPTYEQLAKKYSPNSQNTKHNIIAMKRKERAYAMMFQKSIYDPTRKGDSENGKDGDDEIKDIIPDKRLLQSEIVDKKLNKAHLKKAFKKLSNEQRGILEMIYGLVDNIEKTNVEIAKELNLPVNKITSIKRISLEILKKELPEIIQKQVKKRNLDSDL